MDGSLSLKEWAQIYIKASSVITNGDILEDMSRALQQCQKELKKILVKSGSHWVVSILYGLFF